MTKVNMTTAQMMNAFGALQRLSGEKLPMKGSYGVSRLITKLKPEFDTAEEKRVQLVKELGESDDNGQTFVKPGTDNYNTFLTRFAEIESTELELDLPLVKLEHLGDIEIEPALINAVEMLIAE